ncbi:MAG TPA: O-antigen ligase family protein [Steroidobacteraceae bacterium]|nr:O-antigen ligase family protein [Steroidobacteraceae bacterium]
MAAGDTLAPADGDAVLAPTAVTRFAGAGGDTLIFALFLAHTAISVLTLGARIPAIGAVRPTLLLDAMIWIWWVVSGHHTRTVSGFSDPWGRRLLILFVYSVATIPFTMWPGSVLRSGLPTFLEAASFLYFCVFLCTTWQRLRLFVLVWMGCQIFRMLQPVYLHLTADYWGDIAYLGHGEAMNRLSGAPGDVVNPNGLGFIVASVLPFLHYLVLGQRSRLLKLGYVVLLGCLLYGLGLTGSRSAVLALLIDLLLIAWRSKRRLLMLGLVTAGLAVSFSFLGTDLADRYQSLFSNNTRNAATREGRLTGLVEDLKFGLQRPVFGFGLGTSHEAKWNLRHDRFSAHDMYAEALIELGFVGLFIFLGFLAAIIRCVSECRRALARAPPTADGYNFMQALTSALRVWVPMALVFFLSQYGLREFDWYIFGGMAAALHNLLKPYAVARGAGQPLAARWLGRQPHHVPNTRGRAPKSSR